MNRLEILTQFYEEEPNVPFNLYALATEYLKTNPEKTKELFDELLLNSPDYLPTYYHSAALNFELGNHELADTIYQKGIVLALSQKNEKAHKELQGAYRYFLDEIEEG